MQSQLFLDGKQMQQTPSERNKELSIVHKYTQKVKQGQTYEIHKFGGYIVNTQHKNSDLIKAAKKALKQVSDLGFDTFLLVQKQAWAKIWKMSDITIEGDVKAQQGIRFNIFQLNQTYLGKDSRLNIGPKGFTGEKYGGSTYWDTEAYCIPFYMATKDQKGSAKSFRISL